MLQLDGVRPGSVVHLTTLDDRHGNAQTAYHAMGSPTYPTAAQIGALNRAARLPAATPLRIDDDNTITLDLAPNALALIEVPARKTR